MTARHARGLAGLLAMGLVGTACLNLPNLEPGTCGNRTLEAGEDCERLRDGSAEVSECLPAGAENACRYSCAVIAPSVGPERFPCPSGWGCGADNICRRSSGGLGERIATGQPVGRWFAIDDMDGDEQLDVVSVSDATAAVDYLENGIYQESFRFPFEAEGLPSVTDANQDGRGDLVSTTEIGVEILRGEPTRELSRTIFTSQNVRLDQDFEIVIMDLFPELLDAGGGALVPARGEEVLLPGDAGWGTGSGLYRYGVEPGQTGVELAVSTATDRIQAGRFDETPDTYGAYTESPDQVAVPFADRVVVLRPSYIIDPSEEIPLAFFVEAPTEASDPNFEVPAEHPSRTVVRPDMGFRIDAMRFIQANGESPFEAGRSRWPCGGTGAVADEHLDIVVIQRIFGAQEQSRVAVAFGLGDGTFHSNPCELEDVAANVIPADNGFGESDITKNCGQVFDILAYDDIDGDGMPDPIGETSISLSGLLPDIALLAVGLCDGELSELGHPENGFFREVITGDMDGDGISDVLASSVEPNLRFVTSNGGPQLLRTAVVTEAIVEGLTGGDFDGNGLMDAAFFEVSSTSARDMGVVFGERGDVPGEAELVGTIAGLDRLRAGRLNVDGEADAADDIIASTGRDETNLIRFGLVRGRADRLLRAPFLYGPGGQSVGTTAVPTYLPRGAAIGAFSGLCPQGTEFGPALFITGTAIPTSGASSETTMGAACIEPDGRVTVLEDDASPMSLDPEEVSGTAVVPIRGADGVLSPVIAQFDVRTDQRLFKLFAPERSVTTGLWQEGENSFELLGATVAGAGAPGSSEFAPTSPLRRWSPFLNNVAQSCALWKDRPEGIAFLAIHDEPDYCGGDSVDLPASLKVHVASSARFTPGEAVLPGEELVIVGESDNEHVVGFACLNLDDDPEQELAYLVLIGDVDQCDATEPESFEAEVRVRNIEDSNGDDTITVAGRVVNLRTVAGLPPATGLGAGDFNRDGVEDIFLATPETGYVWLAEPSR